MDDIVCDTIDSNQFGGIVGQSTTDALVEMTHIDGTRRLIYLKVNSVGIQKRLDNATRLTESI